VTLSTSTDLEGNRLAFPPYDSPCIELETPGHLLSIDPRMLVNTPASDKG
tara:strand:+ start:469 stop:618 length:150 start_codon:yes stop_codon:yes gene_type:complete